MINMKIRFTVLFLMIFSGAVWAQNKIEIGKKAPEIVMTKADGTSFALSSLKGKLVLIDFGQHGVLHALKSNRSSKRCMKLIMSR